MTRLLLVCTQQRHIDAFLDGYCSTVQGLLDWFEVDLGFTELLFMHTIDSQKRTQTHRHTDTQTHRLTYSRAQKHDGRGRAFVAAVHQGDTYR